VDNRRHVLDHSHLRPQHLCRPYDPKIEAVSRILSSGAVVEVGVALTRWPGDQNIHVADDATKLALS
jgi:hypothetical protein